MYEITRPAISRLPTHGVKAKVHVRLVVCEHWMIDAATLDTSVHLAPAAEGDQSVVTDPPLARLTPTLRPSLTLALTELGIA